ncbi:MAG: hypothetical protein HKN23_15830 [Verrucomicrobiales bacterium]|nr:hypothetical protein [Verrucomicrobiales bacterium]
MQKPAAFFLCLLPVSLLFSCASARVDFVDPNLTGASLESKTIAIAGVVAARANSGEANFSEAERKSIANAAEAILRKKHGRRLTVVGPSEFCRNAGGGPNRTVSSADSGLLSKALSGAEIVNAREAGIDFVLLIEPTGNCVTRDIDRSSSTDTDYVYDKDGNVVSCTTTTEYTTSADTRRHVSARYHLFDLRSRERVWQTSSEHGETHSRSNCSSVCYPPAPAYPRPPTVPDVMENMSAAAMKKLPKERLRLFAGR